MNIQKARKKVYKSDRISKILNKANNEGALSDQDFRFFISELLISEGGYIMDTGTNVEGNAIIAIELLKRIKKHKLLWKILFMIA